MKTNYFPDRYERKKKQANSWTVKHASLELSCDNFLFLDLPTKRERPSKSEANLYYNISLRRGVFCVSLPPVKSHSTIACSN